MSASAVDVPSGTAPTTRRLLMHGRAVLAAAGISAPVQDAEWLLADLLGCERFRLHLDDVDVPLGVVEAYRERLDRRVRHEPRQHILGWEEFCGLRVTVSPEVLIPRQETEGLVAWVVELLPPDGTAWDIGTGSGCIACALATARPDCRVVASDRSSRALATAAANVQRLGLETRVAVVAADLFDGVRARVDVIVANPPYMPESGPALPEEVRAWEPRGALDGGADGMAVSAQIIAGAPRALRPGGWLVMEIGESQAPSLTARLETSSFRAVSVRRDLAGRERYIAARLPGQSSPTASPGPATQRRSSAGMAVRGEPKASRADESETARSAPAQPFLGEASEGASTAPSDWRTS